MQGDAEPTVTEAVYAAQGEDSHWLLSVSASMASVFSVFIPIILTRLLSIDEVGIYKNLFLYLSLATGLSLTAGYLSTLSFLAGSLENPKGRIAASLSQMLTLSIISAAVAFFAAPSYALLFSLAFGLSCIHTGWEEVLVANGKVKLAAKFTVFFELLRSFCLPLIALIFPSVASLLIVYIAVSVSKLVTGLILALRAHILDSSFSLTEFIFTAKLAIPISLSWFLGSFADRMDQLILTQMVPAGEFAIYSLGCLVIPPLLVFEQSIMKVCISKISKLLQADEVSIAIKVIQNSISELALLIIPSALFLAFNAASIVHLLFTPKFSDAAEFLAIYSLFYVMLLFPGDLVLRALGKSKELVRVNIVGSIGTAVGCWVAYTVSGQVGLLVVFLACRLSVRLYALWIGARIIKVPLYALLPLRFYQRASYVVIPVIFAELFVTPGFIGGMIISFIVFLWLINSLLTQTLVESNRVLLLGEGNSKEIRASIIANFTQESVGISEIAPPSSSKILASIMPGIKLAATILTERAKGIYLFSEENLSTAAVARAILLGRIEVYFFTDNLSEFISRNRPPPYSVRRLSGVCVELSATKQQDVSDAIDLGIPLFDFSALSVRPPQA